MRRNHLPSPRNIASGVLIASFVLIILLARCGTDSQPGGFNSGIDSGPGSGGPDSGTDSGIGPEQDGGTDGGSQLDGGTEQDGGADGGEQNDGGMTQNDGGMTQNDAGTGVSYQTHIRPIFEADCANSGCHAPPFPAGGLDLSVETSRDNLVNRPTTCRPSVSRVAPGDPAESMLWRKIKPVGLPDRCGGIMPLGTMGLGIIAPEDFAKIEQWIQQGALDN